MKIIDMMLFFVLMILCGGSLHGATFDRIVALVDDEIILQSDLAEFESIYQDQPMFSSLSDEEKRKQLLDKLIDEKVMLVIANRDTSLKISEGEIEAGTKMHLGRIIEENGGEDRFETLLKQTNGMTLSEFREQIKRQVKEQILKQRLQEKYCGTLDPSGLQIKQFYQEYKDSLPVFKNNYKISHLELGVNANRALVKQAYKTCDSIIKLLDKGESFKTLAQALSDDPSGTEGGDLGFTKRGVLDPDYEKVAFRLNTGEYTSIPVRTQFGFHIIKMTAKRDVEIRTSHILIRVVPTREDTLHTIALLDSIRSTAKEKGNFSELVKIFSEDKKTKDKGGNLGWFTQNTLNTEYREIVDSLSAGQISVPLFINGKYHLFRLDEYRDERKLSLEDDWNQINVIAKNYLLNKKLSGFLKKWRKEVHIDKRIGDGEKIE
jgi:peptidyl-prolyl cis-trans isomerase SurA